VSSTGRKKADGSKTEKAAFDFYATPDRLAYAIVDDLVQQRVLFPGALVLEPSVGGGAFVRAIHRHPQLDRVTIHGIDIRPDAEGLRLCDEAGTGDFLEWDPVVPVGCGADGVPRHGYDLVLGNPPFTDAELHLRHALEAVPTMYVCFLLRTGFLAAKSRRELFDEWPISTERKISPRPSFTGGGSDGATYGAYLWPTNQTERTRVAVRGMLSKTLYSDVAWHRAEDKSEWPVSATTAAKSGANVDVTGVTPHLQASEPAFAVDSLAGSTSTPHSSTTSQPTTPISAGAKSESLRASNPKTSAVTPTAGPTSRVLSSPIQSEATAAPSAPSIPTERGDEWPTENTDEAPAASAASNTISAAQASGSPVPPALSVLPASMPQSASTASAESTPTSSGPRSPGSSVSVAPGPSGLGPTVSAATTANSAPSSSRPSAPTASSPRAPATPTGSADVTWGLTVLPSTPDVEAPAPSKPRSRKPTMYIKTIESNAKGLSAPVELGQKTLLLGPSRSAKSTIVNAIELALTGRASDIAGKDRSMAADLLALAPGRIGTLYAKATLSDGRECSWSTESNGPGSAKTPQHAYPNAVDPAHVLPLRDLREAITGKPEKARRFFLQAATGSVTGKDIMARIPETLHDSYWTIVEGLFPAKMNAMSGEEPVGSSFRETFSHDPIGTLLAVRDRAHRVHLDERKRANDLEASLGRTGAMQAQPTEAQIEKARQDLTAAETTLEQAIRADSQRGVVEIQQRAALAAQQLPELQQALATAEQQVAVHTAALQSGIPPEAQAMAARGAALMMLADWQVQRAENRGGVDNCALCASSTNLPNLMAQRGAIEHAVTALAQQNAEAQQRQVALAQALQEWQVYRSKQATAVEQAQWDVEQAERTAAHLPGLPEGLPTLEDARFLRDTARSVLTKLTQADAAWSSISSVRTSAHEAAEARDQAARLRDACETAAKELLETSIGDFCTKVQQFLPETDRFGLRLNEGTRDVCQLGLWRPGSDGDVLHTALSGAEWSMVTAAIAAAMSDGLAYVCIIPEERAYDPKTLRAVMKSLGAAGCQVILTSVVKPYRGTPAGWTVVNVEGLGAPVEVGDDEVTEDPDSEPAAPDDNGAGAVQLELTPPAAEA